MASAPLILPAGIHADVAAEAYHADPCERPSLTASIAHELLTRSPLHAWTAHPKLNPNFKREEEQRFDVGTAVHSLVLQGEHIVHVVEAPDWRTKAAQEVRDEARRHGLIPLLTHQWEQVEAMIPAFRRHLVAVDAAPALFVDGEPEQTLVWEEAGGVICRARVDWLHDDHATIDDLKTTVRSANPRDWARTTLWSIGADIQNAFYLRGLEAVTGKRAAFRFVIAECSPPYAASVVSLAPSALELANAKVERAIGIWRDCLETGEWPAYPAQIAYAEEPGWELERWLEREHEEALA